MSNPLPFSPLPRAVSGRGGRRQRLVSFDRTEMRSLTSWYTGQVAAGRLRDYSLDLLPGQALYSVYRATHEQPLYTWVKSAHPSGRGFGYTLFHSRRKLKWSERGLEPLLQAAQLHLAQGASKSPFFLTRNGTTISS